MLAVGRPVRTLSAFHIRGRRSMLSSILPRNERRSEFGFDRESGASLSVNDGRFRVEVE